MRRTVQLAVSNASLETAHYLLAHNIGNHDGTNADEHWETVYYRLHARGHRDHWCMAATHPLAEFRA